MFNRKRLLSAGDAGLHMCTVSDSHGNFGQASLKMRFEGKMCMVEWLCTVNRSNNIHGANASSIGCVVQLHLYLAHYISHVLHTTSSYEFLKPLYSKSLRC